MNISRNLQSDGSVILSAGAGEFRYRRVL